MITYSLTTHDNTVIQELLREFDASPEDPVEFILCASRLSKRLPQHIKETLDQFKHKSSITGFMVFRDVGLDVLPNTPPDNRHFVGEKTDYAKIIALFNQYLGNMIAYEGEGYGRLFQDMVPNKMLSDSQTSLGSKTELEIHTEQAFSKLRPDVLVLGCLRGDANAATYILPVNILLDHLTDEQIECLRAPLWKIGVDLSFRMSQTGFIEGECRGPIPILYGSEEDPLLVFDQDLMTGIHEEAEALKQVIIDVYYKYRYAYVMQPGEIVLIDNQRAVHGRSPFTPRYDGTDRFIIRSFVTFDLEKSGYARSDEEPYKIQAKYS